jgi:hypothetical protein
VTLKNTPSSFFMEPSTLLNTYYFCLFRIKLTLYKKSRGVTMVWVTIRHFKLVRSLTIRLIQLLSLFVLLSISRLPGWTRLCKDEWWITHNQYQTHHIHAQKWLIIRVVEDKAPAERREGKWERERAVAKWAGGCPPLPRPRALFIGVKRFISVLFPYRLRNYKWVFESLQQSTSTAITLLNF